MNLFGRPEVLSQVAADLKKVSPLLEVHAPSPDHINSWCLLPVLHSSRHSFSMRRVAQPMLIGCALWYQADESKTSTTNKGPSFSRSAVPLFREMTSSSADSLQVLKDDGLGDWRTLVQIEWSGLHLFQPLRVEL